MIDLSTLFESKPRLASYQSLRAELQAVQSHEKAMSVFFFQQPATEDENYVEILETALALGLLVVQHTERPNPERTDLDELFVFVLDADQMWRIPAYIATRKVLRHYDWSDGAEYLESYLLGYSSDKISSWMGNIRNTRVGWTGRTIYFLMSNEQREHMFTLGMRCLDPRSNIENMMAFFSRSRPALKSNVLELIPDGMTIARASIKRSFFDKMFGQSSGRGDRDVILSPIAKETAASLNSALESNFQFLGADGWR